MKKTLAGAALLICASASAIAWAESPGGPGIVTAVAGRVTVTRLGAAPRPVRLGDVLYWHDIIEARKDSIARVLLGGRTTVTVRELSRLELRQAAAAEGFRYTVDLISGKVRASVARMLMRPGEQVEVRTRNAVASVRGTDFIVETVERPIPSGPFGLLEAREVAQGMAEGGASRQETVVTTLSGVVEVSSRLTGEGHVERVGAYEAARVSGRADPVRIGLQPDDVKVGLRGLTPPRLRDARGGARALVVQRQRETAVPRAFTPSLANEPLGFPPAILFILVIALTLAFATGSLGVIRNRNN